MLWSIFVLSFLASVAWELIEVARVLAEDFKNGDQWSR